MDIQLLEDIGLTKPQATAYAALVRLGGSSAPTIAQEINESRSNAYKILDKLCELGLATKERTGKRMSYSPTSPTVLEQLIQHQTATVELRKRKLQAAMPDMINAFVNTSERPSIRYFQGQAGLRQIFGDMLQTGRDIYLLRSPEDVAFYDEAFFADFRKKRSLLGIKTYALTVDVSSAVHDPKVDFKNKFIRTWLPAGAYTGSVEWNIYGNKVALLSYGKEAIGIIIESPQIAESFRQVFQLAGRAFVAGKPAARA